MTTTTQDQDQCRAEFEAEFPVPGGVSWSGSKYEVRDDYLNSYSVDRFVGQWDAWQAAWNRRAAPAQPTDAELAEFVKATWGELPGAFVAAHLEAARALLAKYGGAAEPSGWQPIETAPKYEQYRDGSHAFSPHILGWYRGAMAPMRMRWWQADSGESNFLADGGFATHPTHWMLLPPPPPKETR